MSLSTEELTDQSNQKTSGFQEDLESLRQTPLLRGLDYECLKLLAMLSRRVTLITDDRLMVQGEEDGQAFLILSGLVNAIHTKGETSLSIGQFGPNQFVGGCALLGRLPPRLFTLIAMEDTAILRLGREEFQKTVQQFPSAVAQISCNLISELVSWDQQLLETSGIDENLSIRSLGISLL